MSDDNVILPELPPQHRWSKVEGGFRIEQRIQDGDWVDATAVHGHPSAAILELEGRCDGCESPASEGSAPPVRRHHPFRVTSSIGRPSEHAVDTAGLDEDWSSALTARLLAMEMLLINKGIISRQGVDAMMAHVRKQLETNVTGVDGDPRRSPS